VVKIGKKALLSN